MISQRSKSSVAQKPNLIVIIGRPGSGKSTLIKRWQPKRHGYRLHDVYPHMRRVAWIGQGRMDQTKTLEGYKALYVALAQERSQSILELSINHPAFNLAQLARFSHRFTIKLFFLLRNTKQCFAYKKKQRGTTFDSKQLKTRMRWPFPGVHERLAKRFDLQHQRIYMSRGYPAAIRSIERKLYIV